MKYNFEYCIYTVVTAELGDFLVLMLERKRSLRCFYNWNITAWDIISLQTLCWQIGDESIVFLSFQLQ